MGLVTWKPVLGVSNQVKFKPTCSATEISWYVKILHGESKTLRNHMSHDMRFPTMWYVQPAKTQTSLRIPAIWSEALLVAWIFYECSATDWTSSLSLKRGCTGLFEPTLVKRSNCWKYHVSAEILSASVVLMQFKIGPQLDKTCLLGVWQREMQTSLLSYSYRYELENWNFTCIKYRYVTFQKANYRSADMSVNRKKPKTDLFALRPNLLYLDMYPAPLQPSQPNEFYYR